MFISSNLKCFIVLAREKSLKKASEILFVTSSPISRRIKILEDELGYKLFSRKDHDFTLTKKGHELYEEIMPYYTRISEMEVIYSKKRSGLNVKRSVMIGMENFNPFLFKKIINKKRKTACVSWCSSDASQSLESLLASEMQAVITYRNIDHPGIAKMNFSSESVCYLLSEEIENYQLSDMKNLPIIIPKNALHDDYIKIAHTRILTVCPMAQVIIVDDISNYLFLIRSGEAVGIMTESMALFYKNKHTMPTELNYSVDHSFPAFKTYIYYLKECENVIKEKLEDMLPDGVDEK